MEAVFLKLLNMSITACWLVLAVVVLRLVLKKAPKAITCALWALVAVRLLCPFSVESVLSLIPNTEPVQQQMVHEPTVYTQIVAPFSEETQISAEQRQQTEPVTETSGQKLLSVASVVWLVGMGVMLLYTAVSFICLHRRTREGVAREKGVWLCDRIESPFILGIIRPRIFLPSSLDPADADFVLAHEHAHIKRLDHLWKPLGFLLLTVYWFNPVLWLAYILLCRDIELACDEKVLLRLGMGCKQNYSTALINCSVSRRMISACPLAFGEVGVKGRIKAILNYKKPAFWIVLIALIASAVVAVCFLTNPEREQDPEQKTGTVTLEMVSQQSDSVTVRWVNKTEHSVVLGYYRIYREENGRWGDCFEEYDEENGVYKTFRDWAYSLDAGASYEQKINYLFMGVTQPGHYRLEMEYSDTLGGQTQTVQLEFQVTEPVETLSGDSPNWRIKLNYEGSPDPLKPMILLSDDGQFQFRIAGLSSYIAFGTYEQTDEELILTTTDGSYLSIHKKRHMGL